MYSLGGSACVDIEHEYNEPASCADTTTPGGGRADGRVRRVRRDGRRRARRRPPARSPRTLSPRPPRTLHRSATSAASGRTRARSCTVPRRRAETWTDTVRHAEHAPRGLRASCADTTTPGGGGRAGGFGGSGGRGALRRLGLVPRHHSVTSASRRHFKIRVCEKWDRGQCAEDATHRCSHVR